VGGQIPVESANSFLIFLSAPVAELGVDGGVSDGVELAFGVAGVEELSSSSSLLWNLEGISSAVVLRLFRWRGEEKEEEKKERKKEKKKKKKERERKINQRWNAKEQEKYHNIMLIVFFVFTLDITALGVFCCIVRTAII
jgi:hypothetical protein